MIILSCRRPPGATSDYSMSRFSERCLVVIIRPCRCSQAKRHLFLSGAYNSTSEDRRLHCVCLLLVEGVYPYRMNTNWGIVICRFDYGDRFPEALAEIGKWASEGRIVRKCWRRGWRRHPRDFLLALYPG